MDFFLYYPSLLLIIINTIQYKLSISDARRGLKEIIRKLQIFAALKQINNNIWYSLVYFIIPISLSSKSLENKIILDKCVVYTLKANFSHV